MQGTTQTAFTPFLQVVNPEMVVSVIVTIVFIWWAIFSVVAIYHLLRFARDSWITVPAIALHLLVSGWIFVFATGGLH